MRLMTHERKGRRMIARDDELLNFDQDRRAEDEAADAKVRLEIARKAEVKAEREANAR